jgi:hypothetical protein
MNGPAPRRGTYKFFDFATHPVFEPVGPWQIFQGYCSWQVSAQRAWTGPATVVGDPVENNSSDTTSLLISGTYTSSPQFSVSVGSYTPTAILQFFSEAVDPGLFALWAYTDETSQNATWADVEPCTQVLMTFEPDMLSIRAVMVFELVNYQWANNPHTTVFSTWRGLDSVWGSIYSSTYFVEGDAGILSLGNQQDQVSGTFTLQDQPVTSGACSSKERYAMI